MKHIIILGDGMADHAVERLGGKTPMQYAHTPIMDQLAKMGRCGRLLTIPEGFNPGSEVANTTILGYDMAKVYEGRGPLEAASIGFEMQPDDLAIRCNIITLKDGEIKNHHGGHLTTEEGDVLIKYLNEHLGNERIQFITGIQYRHLLVIKGGNKQVDCAPPHDHPNEAWQPLLPKASIIKSELKAFPLSKGEGVCRMTPEETASLLTDLILKSQDLLAKHPFNIERVKQGKDPANSIWPWSGGYRPQMQTLMEMYPQVKSGAVISAVDLIKGIGRYAGLRSIVVEGATGLANTNYEGKAAAAIEALKQDDFVFLHVEASDEAGHDGDVKLKIHTIEDLDKRIVEPIFNMVKNWNEPVCIAVLPDHPTPVELRIHVAEPVPFLFWYRGIEPDEVQTFDEISCVNGSYGLLKLNQFMEEFMAVDL